MGFTVERINNENYPLFDDMVFRRGNGCDREPSQEPVPEQIKKELASPGLYIYAAKQNGCFVGWISLVYIPKVGKWNGHEHIYVDELWVEPIHRGKGIAKALMAKADGLKNTLEATGIRLYVDINNPAARGLYGQCGYTEHGTAFFMKK